MTTDELKRIKEITQQADVLASEITKLTEAVKVGGKTKAIKFGFDPWIIEYENGDTARLERACSAGLLKEVAEDFRSAFVGIVQKTVDQKQREYDALQV